jgi:hypothetical protein
MELKRRRGVCNTVYLASKEQTLKGNDVRYGSVSNEVMRDADFDPLGFQGRWKRNLTNLDQRIASDS